MRSRGRTWRLCAIKRHWGAGRSSRSSAYSRTGWGMTSRADHLQSATHDLRICSHTAAEAWHGCLMHSSRQLMARCHGLPSRATKIASPQRGRVQRACVGSCDSSYSVPMKSGGQNGREIASVTSGGSFRNQRQPRWQASCSRWHGATEYGPPCDDLCSWATHPSKSAVQLSMHVP
jgi:hypothetical protein